MKKLLATVLAMLLALSMATAAFASFKEEEIAPAIVEVVAQEEEQDEEADDEPEADYLTKLIAASIAKMGIDPEGALADAMRATAQKPFFVFLAAMIAPYGEGPLDTVGLLSIRELLALLIDMLRDTFRAATG